MSAPEKEAPPPLAQEQSDSSVLKKQKSWVEAVDNRLPQSKHVFQVEVVVGASMVEIPDDLIQNSVPFWEDFLEGKFLAPAPHVAKIHVIVNKIWPLGNKSVHIDVFSVNETTVKFRIKDVQIRGRILRRGMWNIADIPMVVSKWSPIVDDDEPEVKIIPMWITLKNVPHKMYLRDGLDFITSAVGKPVRLHPETELCSNFEEAKVFVEADMSKELPQIYRFKSKLGIDAEVEFVYPWLPSRSSTCSKWGHSGKDCQTNVGTSALVSQVPMVVATKEILNGEVQVQEKENVRVEDVNTPIEILATEVERKVQEKVTVLDEEIQTTEVLATEVEMNLQDTEDSWSLVSPGKTRRSEGREPANQEVIISPSRF